MLEMYSRPLPYARPSFSAACVVRIIVLSLFTLISATGPVWCQEAERNEDLPGYYEFFMKAGKLTRIADEVKQDERIQSGELKPVHVGKPAVEVRLPDGFGKQFGPRDYVGEKNLVLITGRAWW